MRSILDKWPGSKTITLIVVLIVLNIAASAGVITEQAVADFSNMVLYPAVVGTAYLGLTRE